MFIKDEAKIASKDLNQLRIELWIPNQYERRVNEVLW